MLLVAYGNGIRMWVKKKMEWVVYHFDHKHCHQRQLGYINFLRLSSKKSVLVSAVCPVHAPVKY